MSDLLLIGTRVYHKIHGDGTVVGYNEREPGNGYMPKDGLEALRIATALGVLGASSIHDEEQFPYEVRFDSGFEEVYGPHSLEVIGQMQ